MSETKVNSYVSFGGLFFWFFITVKLVGHIFADWSWWWVLAPIIPVIGEVVRHFGL
jgi:fatty acid desaturase